MSGSLTQEGMIEVKDLAGAIQAIIDDTGTVSGSSHLSAGGNLTVAGTVSLGGVADTAIAVASDSIYFKDADGSMKSDTVADLMTATAGSGLAASSGVLSVDIDELSALGSAALHQTQDHFMFSDNGTEKKITFSNLQDAVFADVSGDATIAAGGALTIAATSVETGMLADDAVTGAKIALFDDSLAATDTHFLIADGSDYSSFALSGDVTCTNAGVVTIGAGAVQADMLNDDCISGQSNLGGTGVADADEFIFSDGGTLKALTGANLYGWVFGKVSGDATIASGGALTIAAGAVENSMLADDAVGADELAANAVVNASIASNAAIDLDKLDGGSCAASLSDLAQGDLLYAGDVDASNAIKSITFSDLEDAIFGNVSGDATIAAGGALTIGAGNVEGAMLNTDVISAQTELASDGLAAADELMISDAGALKKIGVDNLFKDGPGLLTAATVDVAADHFMFLDGGATGDAKTESVADLVTGMAGAGLTATSGVLSVTGNNVALKADGNALVEGYNYFADASSNATVTMPAAPAVGDVVTAKAGNLTSGATIIINKGSADHRIDGLEGIVIESPFGAVTMVYVVADQWKIV